MSEKSILRSFFTNDKIMLILVVINTITIFIGGYGSAPRAFLWIDSFFTILFLIEALVKIRTYKWANYWGDNWNKFDFIITLVAIPSLLNLFTETGLATNILLSLRSLRIFKSFRLLKFIPNINGLLKGIGLAMKASLIVTIAFAVLLLSFPYYRLLFLAKQHQISLAIRVCLYLPSFAYSLVMDGQRFLHRSLKIAQNSWGD